MKDFELSKYVVFICDFSRAKHLNPVEESQFYDKGPDFWEILRSWCDDVEMDG